MISLISVVTMGVTCGTRSGGDSRCYTVCERANACALTQRAVDVECSELCPDVEDMQARMEAAGFGTCQAEYEQHLDCWMSNLGQICTTPTLCAESGTAWTTCMTSYCQDNIGKVAAKVEGVYADRNCRGSKASNAAPALRPF
jgi:hypothetical protein